MKNNRTFRVEAYHKEYSHLVTFEPEFNFDPDYYDNNGQGYASGFDLFFRDSKSVRNGDFWISYSYLDTERKYRHFPMTAAPSYTSKHNFSIVYKHFISKLKSQLGATYSFSSGRPYNNPSIEKFNNQRAPAFHDLSANISYLPKPNLIVYASVTNVLGKDNIFGYQFREGDGEQDYYERRAITLPASRFLFIGIFITLTNSGTASQLPNL
jgi:outer membrane receptor for ferrienterochelin and colicin